LPPKLRAEIMTLVSITTLGIHWLCTAFIDQSFHVRFSQAPLLGFQASIAVKPLPLFILNIAADGLPEKFAAGALFFLGQLFSLFQEFRKERNGDKLAGSHRNTSFLLL
jgi:hypothetical protein